MEEYAKKTYLALINPYKTVYKVFPQVIDDVRDNLNKYKHSYYFGVKKDRSIKKKLIENLINRGYCLHTVDYKALGGRSIDLRYVNPLTGNLMTGSSSATALNVLYGINDLGIGTDGGGSVLAPAVSLNLFAFISPLFIDKNKLELKESTDNIKFSPSIGFICKDFYILYETIDVLLDIKNKKKKNLEIHYVDEYNIDILDDRKQLIDFLKKEVVEGKLLISNEGPIDFYGYGDSIFGNFSERTKEIQKSGNKGLLRVINMANKTGLVIPQEDLGKAKLLICDSNLIDIHMMLEKAKEFIKEKNALIEKYFSNYNMYFDDL